MRRSSQNDRKSEFGSPANEEAGETIMEKLALLSKEFQKFAKAKEVIGELIENKGNEYAISDQSCLVQNDINERKPDWD
jgi:hypothetical protein